MMFIGDVLKIIADIPRPARDADQVRAFVQTLDRNHNMPATESQMQEAQRLAAQQPAR